MSAEVKRYAVEHLAGVRDLIIPIQREEFGFDITYEEQPDLTDVDGFYRKGEGEFWVAVSGHDVIGTIALLDLGNGQGALRKMFVDKNYRGGEKKVAQQLLDGLIDYSRKTGFSEIYLGTTEAFRAAHRFYEKAGFVLIPEKNLPDNFPQMKADTRFYFLET